MDIDRSRVELIKILKAFGTNQGDNLIVINTEQFDNFKNVFAYLSMYYLNPIRNHILNDMRTAMYKKILQLPIGFFSDQRKGDIMSLIERDRRVITVHDLDELAAFAHAF